MDEGFIRPAEHGDAVIPNGTEFKIIEIDRDNKMVLVEFIVNDETIRAWTHEAYFEKASDQ